MPAVTIGLPIYNNRRTLPEALASIFAQTFEDWELIAVNDGSTDGSLELLQQVRDPRVRLISDGKRRALAARLNQIAREAQGRFLARMDGDDVMHPRRLEVQAGKLSSQHDLLLVGSAAYVIDSASRLIGKRKVSIASPNARSVLRARGFLVHPSVCGQTAWFRDNPYSEAPWCERSQDLDLWVRTVDRIGERFYHSPEPLLFYRNESFDYAKYRKNMRAARHVAARYGMSSMGLVRTVTLLGRLWALQALYRGSSLAGFADRLVSRRFVPLNSRETTEAELALRLALAQPVPGLNDHAAAV